MKRNSGFRWGRIKSEESGYILVLSLFVMAIATVVGLGLIVVGMNEFNLSNRTKLMDRAYDIAEAGVNRAAVQLKLQPTLATDNQTSTHLYNVSGCTPQWPLNDNNGYSEPFEDGTYNVTLWQSERTSPRDETQLPQFKVVRSTGTITRGGMTAQRTIEARIVAGAPNTEYDASFDYCIYNGFNKQNGHGDWGGNAYWAGNWTWDAATPDENGHRPKGAIYSKGNLTIPCAFLGDLNIKGNVVATDNIQLRNVLGIGDRGDTSDFTITKGNVVAGINRDHISDDLDSNNIHISTFASIYNSSIAIYGDGDSTKGFLVAAKDITLDSTISIWSRAIQAGVNIDTGAIEGGAVAGRDVEITGVDASMRVGKIFSGRETKITNSPFLIFFGQNIGVNEIRAGQNLSESGYGVRLDANAFSSITTGAISSWGEVYGTGDAQISTGDIKAGNNTSSDTGGVGVVFSGSYSIGNVSSVGSCSIGSHAWTAIANKPLLNIPPAPQLLNWLDPDLPPQVDVLGAAGLTAPVNLIEPNWSYYQDQAVQDDNVNGPSKGGPAHVVTDGGPGDTGPAGDHKINLKWDATTPYSSNETIYSGDATTTVVIDTLNWTSHDNQVFVGTIVAKGPVNVQNKSSNWRVGTKNELNICSGADLTFTASGVKLWTNNNSRFHFWAKGDIDLTYASFSLGQGNTFYGSFTAGNQVIYKQNTWTSLLGGSTTFKWSRWPLAPQAWVAPVRVLSWREL